MALINCPECGKQISDKANVCIGCGAPIAPIASAQDDHRISGSGTKDKNKLSKIPESNFDVLGFFVLIIIAAFVLILLLAPELLTPERSR